MKKLIIILLAAVCLVSCSKQMDETTTSVPVMLKVQGVDQDGTVVESPIISVK